MFANNMHRHHIAVRNLCRSQGLFSPAQMRAFGGYQPDPNHKYEFIHDNKNNTSYKVPTKADMDHLLPKKATFNEWISYKLSAYWSAEEDHFLRNNKTKYFSLYRLCS